MIRRRRAACFACGIVVLAACGSSSTSDAPLVTDVPATTAPTTSTTPPAPGPKGTLGFREISAQYPWAAADAYPTVPASEPFPGCAKLIERSRPTTASAKETVLPDRNRKNCYVVGPVLVDGASVDAASVIYDSTTTQWAVNVHFANDDFLDKIAGPLVNRQIAIDFDGVVQSAPTINPGITGHDVEITSGFTKQQAIDVAARIAGVAPSSVPVEAADAPE